MTVFVDSFTILSAKLSRPRSWNCSFSGPLIIGTLEKRPPGPRHGRSMIVNWFSEFFNNSFCSVENKLRLKLDKSLKLEWPSFPFNYRLLFIISTHILVAPRNFLSIRTVLSCFQYRLIFYLEKFSTWIRRLPFAVYVKLKVSSIQHVVQFYTTLW